MRKLVRVAHLRLTFLAVFVDQELSALVAKKLRLFQSQSPVLDLWRGFLGLQMKHACKKCSLLTGQAFKPIFHRTKLQSTYQQKAEWTMQFWTGS
jgi:hypothetical protein